MSTKAWYFLVAWSCTAVKPHDTGSYCRGNSTGLEAFGLRHTKHETDTLLNTSLLNTSLHF